MCKKSKLLTLAVYSYIALPFIIFASGFLKWYFAYPLTLAVIAALVLAVRDSKGLDTIPLGKWSIAKIPAGLILIIGVVLLSGIGDVFWQNNDHATRNTIFDILVTYSWPPKYTLDTGEVSLVYYIGFWLPSALLGKVFSLSAGYIFMIIWSVIGLCILWYMLCLIHKRLVIYPLIIFLFFSGLDVFGHSIISSLFSNLSTLQIGKWAFSQGSSLTHHLEWWAKYFQYSSHITQLFWVFNQCLPVWLATVLILLEKNNKNLVFIMGLTLLSSSLPFVGLIPIFVWCAVCDHDAPILDRPFTKDVKSSFFSLFTYQNVIGGGISGIMSFIYLRGNIASGNTASQSATAAGGSTFSLGVFFAVIIFWVIAFVLLSKREKWSISSLLYFIPAIPLAFLMAKLPDYKIEYYLLFIILEFMVYAVLVFPAFRQSSLFFVTVSALLVIPFFIVGKSIDFCMRASIPLLVVLCLLATASLDRYFKENRQILATLLCAVLFLGAVTPLAEIARTVEATAFEIQTKGQVENDSKTTETVFKGRNFTGKTEDNIFFEIFSK